MIKMKQKKHHFILGHQVKEIDKIEQAIEAVKLVWDIDEKSLFQLNLVLEELISNTMFYGFSKKDNGEIDVDLAYDGIYIHVKIHDNAIAFDPTSPLESSVELPLDDREIGGLGIMLSQQISENMKYEYHENKNKLSFMINTKPNVKDK